MARRLALIGAAAALAASAAVLLAADVAIAAFSTAAPGGALPAGWRTLHVARVPPSEVALAAEDGATVLRVRSHGTAGTAAFALPPQGVEATLAWRWKVDRVVGKADLAAKPGDDFAARVYVFFDIPDDAFPFGERLRLKLARLFYGGELPAAAICYVWDNRHPVGTTGWNPYSRRVRTVVVESGAARAGAWVEERRDLGADFRAAFGEAFAASARLTGIAAGNDTDQTLETVTAWFGDFRLAPRADAER
jgi:hypothetical protein